MPPPHHRHNVKTDLPPAAGHQEGQVGLLLTQAGRVQRTCNNPLLASALSWAWPACAWVTPPWMPLSMQEPRPSPQLAAPARRGHSAALAGLVTLGSPAGSAWPGASLRWWPKPADHASQTCGLYPVPVTRGPLQTMLSPRSSSGPGAAPGRRQMLLHRGGGPRAADPLLPALLALEPPALGRPWAAQSL